MIRRYAAKTIVFACWVLTGVNAQGGKRRLALSDGYREFKASWLSLIQDLPALLDRTRLATRQTGPGLGDYPVRGWRHPMTRVMMAMRFGLEDDE